MCKTQHHHFRTNLHNCHDSHCCCGQDVSFRRFRTSEEITEHLETYREQLSKELEGVTEHIQKLQKK